MKTLEKDAKDMLVTTIDRKPFVHKINCNTVFEMLMNLLIMYERNDDQLKCNLMVHFFSYTYARYEYFDLTRITVSDFKYEWIWHHSNRNSKSKNDTGRCITIYFEVLQGYKRFCCIRYTARKNSAYY